ncbi:MAG TPA: hypothetical protein VFF06_23695 [Polyangia bacterium]|nr:hypothetical protein [Polyangia bacterium]
MLKRMLIIDGDTPTRLVLANLFHAEYHVTLAPDARLGRRLLERSPFDVVLCDLAEREALDASPPELAARVILLTDDPWCEVAQQLYAEQWHPIVAKPCRASVLRNLVSRIVALPAAAGAVPGTLV